MDGEVHRLFGLTVLQSWALGIGKAGVAGFHVRGIRAFADRFTAEQDVDSVVARFRVRVAAVVGAVVVIN